MRLCPSCGGQNPDHARFCLHCGASLAEATQGARELRRTATFVFCDVVGSTNLGERLAPETFRRVMSRFFEETRSAVESHGGRISKFAGDAVLGVFGIPAAREDDAWRAVRAAVEVRERITSLNTSLEADFGIRLQTRTGVNTGEIVSGDDRVVDGMVVGDPVNVAARLEQAAGEDEILLGEETWRLVRDAVLVAAPRRQAARGKADGIVAYALLEVRPGDERLARRLDAPMVGRQPELVRLRVALDRAIREHSAQLVTVVGAAGLGKSRLVAEIKRSVAAPTLVLEGHCESYGEGGTFRPLAEIVSAAAGIGREDSSSEALAKLTASLGAADDGREVAQQVARLVGLLDAGTAPEESFPAVRRFLETLAARRPVVVVLDDLQWSEPLLLDLLEYLALRPPLGPVFEICVSRPELLERDLGWPRAGELIRLEPLNEDDSARLLLDRLGAAHIDETARRRIVATAEGHPLFLEELVAMLVERGMLRRSGRAWTAAAQPSELSMPPSIRAVLGARLDTLPDAQRALLECASVIGTEFSPATLSQLGVGSDPETFQDLVRKGLIEPSGRGRFRFHHVLMRDAAYDSVAKGERARIHERLADLLHTEADEIVGHHLEQAYLCRRELGTVGPRERDLAERAADHLASSGRRARGTGDWHIAVNRLTRAASLLPPGDERRTALLPDLGFALFDMAEFEGALAAFDEAIRCGDARIAANARIGHLRTMMLTEPVSTKQDDVLPTIAPLVASLAESGDHAGLARARLLEADVCNGLGLAARMHAAAGHAFEHATRAGARREATESLSMLSLSLLATPRPAEDSLRELAEILERGRGQSEVEVWTRAVMAYLHTERGRFDQARELLDQAAFLDGEPGLELIWTGRLLASGMVNRLAGDLDQAERDLRRMYEVQSGLGAVGYTSTVAAELARVLYEQGRYDEAREAASLAEDEASEGDIASVVPARGVRALVAARTGDVGAAERLAREAVELCATSDFVDACPDAALALAEVLSIGGQSGEALRWAGDALETYRRNGHIVSAARAESLCAEIRAASAPEDVEPHGAQT